MEYKRIIKGIDHILVNEYSGEKRTQHQKRFDRTFAEIVERYPQELIPIINEVFHTNYMDKEQVRLYRDARHEKDGLIVTDSYFGIADSLYHIECQSIKDDEMAIRMIRYDFALAWKKSLKRNCCSLYHSISCATKPQSNIREIRSWSRRVIM